MQHYFATTYEESRECFLQVIPLLQTRWGKVEHQVVTVPEHTDLYTDVVTCTPAHQEQLLVITTGLHGIEGYVGSAVLQLFLEENLMQVDPETTGLCLIHAVNPWGMKYERKVNQHNVDLNRNFVWNWEEPSLLQNPDYEQTHSLFHPPSLSLFSFMRQLLQTIRKVGTSGIKRALTLGQYEYPDGLYYGGREHEFATKMMIQFFHQWLAEYSKVTLFDIHTGYGPSDQMYLVNSRYEQRPTSYFKERLNYPYVVGMSTEEFYEINGDMLDYLYRLQQAQYPHVALFATTVEFGTLGDSTLALLQSLKTTIDENRVHHQEWKHYEPRAKAALQAMYAPSSESWRSKAIQDMRQVWKELEKI